ncbi:MAG: HlyD family efflux transporter periplasmic adaptor subunit [Clostridia bacterium]|nr:HlyD family efflux transporter periplasmic adaptor subunit [Clostridia bacterium]
MPASVLKKEKTGSPAPSGSRRKWPLALGAAILVCAGVFAAGQLREANNAVVISPTDTALLARTDLQDSVSATGTVESAHSMTVYSTKAYTVQEVLVEVGDRVEEGQLLCRLDDQNIRNQIESQEASLNAAQSSSNAAVNSARDNYQQFKASLENGTNASLISAENAVTNAYNAWQTAQEAYDRYWAGLQAGENTTLLAQETTLRNAQNGVNNAYDGLATAEESVEDAYEAVEEAEEALEDAEDLLADARRSRKDLQKELETLEADIETLEAEQGDLKTQIAQAADEAAKAALQLQLDEVEAELDSKNDKMLPLQLQQAQAESAWQTALSTVEQLEAAVKQAEQAAEMAEKQVDTCRDAITTAEENLLTVQKQYSAALTGVDNTLADYAKNVDTAKQAYETAKASLEAAKVAAENQLKAYQNSLNTAYAGANKETMEVGLRQLKAELEGTEITSPMTGTVTAVYAEVGSAGSGLLFIIEDAENFVIATSVKDYDIAAVKVGTPAVIRSDATGEARYAGKVESIAPTANKTAMGVTDTSGDISFATDVTVTDKDTDLRIGLSVRLNFIVAEEKGALAAPYDAVYTNGAGRSCVMTARRQEDGSYLLEEVPVEVGLETDLDIAVKGNGLTEGTVVICGPEQYTQYLGQAVWVGSAERSGLLGGF